MESPGYFASVRKEWLAWIAILGGLAGIATLVAFARDTAEAAGWLGIPWWLWLWAFTVISSGCFHIAQYRVWRHDTRRLEAAADRARKAEAGRTEAEKRVAEADTRRAAAEQTRNEAEQRAVKAERRAEEAEQLRQAADQRAAEAERRTQDAQAELEASAEPVPEFLPDDASQRGFTWEVTEEFEMGGTGSIHYHRQATITALVTIQPARFRVTFTRLPREYWFQIHEPEPAHRERTSLATMILRSRRELPEVIYESEGGIEINESEIPIFEGRRLVVIAVDDYPFEFVNIRRRHPDHFAE